MTETPIQRLRDLLKRADELVRGGYIIPQTIAQALAVVAEIELDALVGAAGPHREELGLPVAVPDTGTEQCPAPLPQTVGECAEWCWERGLLFTADAAAKKPYCRVVLRTAHDCIDHCPDGIGDTPAEAVAGYVHLYGVPPVRGESDD